MATDPEYGRRHFLKDSIVSIAKTAHEFAKHRDAPPEQPAPAVREDWLRPPGAASESIFLDRCTRCGDCIKACPYQAIAVHPANGSPILFPNQTPCYLCEDFPCITACGTDALSPIEGVEQVHMGRLSFHTGPARQNRAAMHVCRNVRPMPCQWISMCYACSCRRMTVSDVGSANIPVKVSTTSLRSRFDRNGSCHGREK